MSFPGTYNINYYFGDTLEFRVFPKNSSGEPFDLNTFSDVRFTIARNRNTPILEHISVFSQIDPNNTSILCAIRPEDCALTPQELNKIQPDTTYVYDIEISKPNDPYNIVYTLLTGSLTIQRDVTRPRPPAPPAEVSPPNNPTNLSLSSSTNSTISVSWTAPATGDEPTNYKLAIIPFTENIETIRNEISATTVSVSASETSYTFPGLLPLTEYVVIVRATNTAGDASIETILFNFSPFSTTDIPPTVPEPPVLLSANALDGSIQIPFTQGSDGNSAIINYSYSLNGEPFVEFDPIQLESPFLISGLTNGTTYSIAIIATNEIGNSEPSNVVSATPQAPIVPDFVVTNDGSTAFLIDGIANDTITLTRGETYSILVDTPNDNFWIQSVPAPYSENDVYQNGITNNGTNSGIILWTVSEDAPDFLYYVSEFNSTMSGTIVIIGGDDEDYDQYDHYDNS